MWVVFFHEMVSQVRLRKKTRFIILTGPRDGRRSTRYRATWENTTVVRRQETGAEGKALVCDFCWGVSRKGRAG